MRVGIYRSGVQGYGEQWGRHRNQAIICTYEQCIDWSMVGQRCLIPCCQLVTFYSYLSLIQVSIKGFVTTVIFKMQTLAKITDSSIKKSIYKSSLISNESFFFFFIFYFFIFFFPGFLRVSLFCLCFFLSIFRLMQMQLFISFVPRPYTDLA